MRSVLATIALWTGLVPAARAGDLTITVERLRSAFGAMLVAVHDDPARFPSDWNGAVALARIAAIPGSVRVVLPGLAPGRYAVIAVHDEDDNGEMSKGAFGFPREGFGTSNNPVFVGPPRFGPALITVTGDASISIRMAYF